jgi:pimeloyl-ACP methyl ester carboxylesterase
MSHVHILLGGLTRFGDGVVTSAGMYLLAKQIRQQTGAIVRTYQWADYDKARRAIIIDQHRSKVAVIGYSGGGSRATWLANQEPRPIIDLMVCYDPSPKWQMLTLAANVKRAICYRNRMPLMFGLGGGVLQGRQVEMVDGTAQHLAVQFDQSLHARTIAAIKSM